jgi:hypothetical protein
VTQPVPDFVVAALEKIAGIREYDPEDYEKAAGYKREDGVWGIDEYLAHTTLIRLGVVGT